MKARIKSFIRALTPPIFLEAVRQYRKPSRSSSEVPDWEYMPQGWDALDVDPRLKGWNDKSVLEAYRRKWPHFLETLTDNKLLGISPEAQSDADANLVEHNILMCYAYALLMASRHANQLSMLDWGGGMGHYLLISRAILPQLKIDYSCKDVPLLAEEGRSLLPEGHFYSDDSCLENRYDFVLASTSLHYSPDWGKTFQGLANATNDFLYVAQLPVVHKADSFVFVQRPYAFGYDTEYLGWALNRQEFLERAAKCGLKLEREFLNGHRPFIAGAPEQCEYRGFLFRQ